MTYYLIQYDEYYDEVYQRVVDDERYEQLKNNDILKKDLHDGPWPDIPIMDGKRSVRHPEFYANQGC